MNIEIFVEETTTNNVNHLRLIGRHPLAGSQLLAERRYDRTTGTYSTKALCRGVGVLEVPTDYWPAAVRESVEQWKEKIHALEVSNAKYDQVGRELFASFVTK